MGKPIACVDYPFQAPQKLYDSAAGEVWFGRSEQMGKPHCRISTGHRGQSGKYLLTLEPPVVMPWTFERWYRDLFEVVISFAGECDATFRHPLPLGWPDLPCEVASTPWEHRKNAVVAVMGNKGSDVAGELYSARVRVVEELHAAGIQVDVYGRPGFDGAPWFRGELEGDAQQKRRKLAQYRFALCMENCSCENYLTEKLPESVLAGCIPIYQGPPNLADWPFPEVVRPSDAIAAVRDYTAEQYAAHIAQVDVDAIKEACSCTSLYKLILSLSA